VVRLRMSLHGRRHRPFYRINAMDSRAQRDGRFIENLGWYDPLADRGAGKIEINAERVKYWLGVGAQPSETVADILAKHNLIDKGPWEARRRRRRELVESRKPAGDPAAKPAEPGPGA
jgi:small subunit ribosomal protein S16